LETDEDPALLTQSSKIIYIKTEDLEEIDNPEKEYRKCIANGQGIFSTEWFDQFESCNVIRQVCKYQSSIII